MSVCLNLINFIVISRHNAKHRTTTSAGGISVYLVSGGDLMSKAVGVSTVCNGKNDLRVTVIYQ